MQFYVLLVDRNQMRSEYICAKGETVLEAVSNVVESYREVYNLADDVEISSRILFESSVEEEIDLFYENLMARRQSEDPASGGNS